MAAVARDHPLGEGLGEDDYCEDVGLEHRLDVLNGVLLHRLMYDQGQK